MNERRIPRRSRTQQFLELDDLTPRIGWRYRREASCVLCGIRNSGRPLCSGCLSDLPRNEEARKPFGNDIGLIDVVWSPFRYSFPIDRLIASAKFDGNLAAAKTLGALMASAAARASLDRPGFLVPIPLHWSRLLRRGFNQSGILANIVGCKLCLPVASDMGCRQIRTRPQMMLGADSRQKNVDGVFRIKPAGLIRSVAIIDDVVTTGSTARSFAWALREAGYQNVQLWALAVAE